MSNFNDKQVLTSWIANADAWTNAIKNQEIESRRLVTNQAMIDAITCYHPSSVLDMGCGEGWLVRELANRGVVAVGLDAIPELIANAKILGGEFYLVSYEDICLENFQYPSVDAMLSKERFSTIAFNFSLVGKEAVEGVIKSVKRYLGNFGNIFIQTVHPLIATGEFPYEDGWRLETWDGFGSNFVEPSPWYFRTVGSWVNLLVSSGFNILECREPINPKTQKPASLILIAQVGSVS
jgi:2-polyprenyl-3-methyl-5-hydroxy-6-metoxy-1,4-benzoquinol methylase